jgi:hypothetical protein
MAFVNAYLTDEQREEFERKCIGNPLSPALPVLKPLEWICDNEKESYLFSIGTHHDYPNEELFFWHWKNQEFILPVKKKNILPNTRVWSLDTSWPNPIIQLQNSVKAEMIEDLKMALEVYRINGTTTADNMSVKIVCDF